VILEDCLHGSRGNYNAKLLHLADDLAKAGENVFLSEADHEGDLLKGELRWSTSAFGLLSFFGFT
jgi:hypothetical protein